jgi:hypothetical protein
VGEVTNGIEDTMSSAADPLSMAPSTAVEALKAVGIACSDAGSFSDTFSVGSAIDIICIQEAKGNREYPVIISRGNMFAKKINIGDNFSGFGEHIYQYIDFVDDTEDPGIKLMPAEEVTCREGVLIQSRNMKGFMKGY